jgi:hypothetical protein
MKTEWFRKKTSIEKVSIEDAIFLINKGLDPCPIMGGGCNILIRKRT